MGNGVGGAIGLVARMDRIGSDSMDIYKRGTQE